MDELAVKKLQSKVVRNWDMANYIVTRVKRNGVILNYAAYDTGRHQQSRRNSAEDCKVMPKGSRISFTIARRLI